MNLWPYLAEFGDKLSGNSESILVYFLYSEDSECQSVKNRVKSSSVDMFLIIF